MYTSTYSTRRVFSCLCMHRFFTFLNTHFMCRGDVSQEMENSQNVHVCKLSVCKYAYINIHVQQA